MLALPMLTQHNRLMWSTPPAAAVLSSLFDCLRAAHADDGVRAIVITGAGKNFSAGADIKSFAAGAPLDGSVNEKFNSLIESGPKPTVAGEGKPAGSSCRSQSAFKQIHCRMRWTAARSTA